MIQAVKWKVKVKGDKRSIQLFDAKGNKVRGEDAYWEGSFDCSRNQLTSLEGSPNSVGKSFDCSRNRLTSLEGAPKEVGGDFYCYCNQLTSIVGAPKEVGGYFDCSYNQLTSLVGAPNSVGKSFDCSRNRLTSLEGAPKTVSLWFDCSRNRLTSLEGAPKTVEGSFSCHCNQLTSLVGAPKEVGGGFYCDKEIYGLHIVGDDILTERISDRKIGDVTVYKCRMTKPSDKSIVYIAHKNDTFAHSKTIKKALEDLAFKTSPRNVEAFRHMKLDQKYSFTEMKAAYRAITGACDFGINSFCENIKAKKYTPIEVIELTKGNFGHDKFKEFFK